MVDKSWLLNPTTLRHAKTCIDLIRQETGTKLKLSQPDFFNVLHNHVNDINSQDLSTAYNNLLEKSSLTANIQPVVAKTLTTEETIRVNGKQLPRWRDGKEFSGFYRGQPRYR